MNKSSEVEKFKNKSSEVEKLSENKSIEVEKLNIMSQDEVLVSSSGAPVSLLPRNEVLKSDY